MRSAAEAKARELLRRSGLPTPWWNASLYDRNGRFMAMPDAWFDDVGMAWEIDSREWHLGPADHARTLERRSSMMAENVIVVHTLPSKVIHDGEAVLADLRANYRHAKQRPRPQVRAIPQP